MLQYILCAVHSLHVQYIGVPLPFRREPRGHALLTWSIARHFFCGVTVSTNVAVACTAPGPGVLALDLKCPWYLTSNWAHIWSKSLQPLSANTCFVNSRHLTMLVVATSSVILEALYDAFCMPERLPTLKPRAANINCSSVGPMGVSCRMSWSLRFPVADFLPGPLVFTSPNSFVLWLLKLYDVHVRITLEKKKSIFVEN